LITGLRHGVGARLPVSSLADRIAVIQQPAILLGLLVTTLWAMGAYTIYTYLAPYLAVATGIEGAHVGPVLFLWGISAAAGLFIGGSLNDKFGARAVMTPSLVLASLTFVSLSLSAAFLSPASALFPVLAAIIVWGVAVWAFFPSQQARLIGIAGMKVAPVALSLNASFMYLGFSLGAALGSLTLSLGSVIDLGWVGGFCEILALLLVLGTTRNTASRATLVAPARGATVGAEGKVQ
jgi:predicted MFS family arabinose efflux permease